MPEIDGSSKPPQISEMFQKFALAFKAKTVEFFAEEDADEADGFSLLDSAEEIITDQKVVVIKPDNFVEPPLEQSKRGARIRPVDIRLAQTLVSSIFASVSKFEASYLQLQTAHVPFAGEAIESADRALVSQLRRLSEIKRFYSEFCCRDTELNDSGVSVGSCLEAQVEENQSKLRCLGTVSDKLQEEIDRKDGEVSALRKRLEEIQSSNSKLSKRLNGNDSNPSRDISLSIRVFDSVLHDASRLTHKFTKILIELMRGVGWDLDLAANSVHPNVNYAKKSHNRYAFLSYVCLGMFRNFDSENFGLSNGNDPDSDRTSSSLRQLLEHVSSSAIELLSTDQTCEFSRFCEAKYQEIIHPTMESSMFSNMDRKEIVLSMWRSLSVFYEAYVNMASSIWTLHKLAFLFDPVVEIFQVERGVDFSAVFMEDITRRSSVTGITRAKVGFTVVPGFRIGRTVIQSQVYLTGMQI